MQPVVHLVVGYLAYAGYTRAARGEPPSGAPTLAAVVAAVVPDLIDKPLAAAGVVDVGRTLGHSLVFALPLIALVWFVATRIDRPTLGVAVAVGYLSHLAADVPWHLLSGDYHELGFLLWPLTPMPPYTGVKPLGTVPGLEVTVTTLWLEGVIAVGGVALWWRDGRPGLETIGRAVGR